MIARVTATDLARWQADDSRPQPVIVDVREPSEFAYCHIEGSVSIPLGELTARVAELPRDKPLVMVCHLGGRSMQAATFLDRNGFKDVHNLRGGGAAWAAEVDPTMKTY